MMNSVLTSYLAMIKTFSVFTILLGNVCLIETPSQIVPGIEWEYDISNLPTSIRTDIDAYVNTLETTGFMVVHGGKIVYEYGDVAEVRLLHRNTGESIPKEFVLYYLTVIRPDCIDTACWTFNDSITVTVNVVLLNNTEVG